MFGRIGIRSWDDLWSIQRSIGILLSSFKKNCLGNLAYKVFGSDPQILSCQLLNRKGQPSPSYADSDTKLIAI